MIYCNTGIANITVAKTICPVLCFLFDCFRVIDAILRPSSFLSIMQNI